jgi:hypothetical protein
MDEGKASLRRLQWQKASQLDSTMLVWLGKQTLGQRDKQEIEHSGEINNPLAGLTTDELRQLINATSPETD